MRAGARRRATRGGGLAHQIGHGVHLERLVDHTVRPELERSADVLRTAERGHQDDLRVRREAADRLEERQIVGIRQPEIQQDDIEPVL